MQNREQQPDPNQGLFRDQRRDAKPPDFVTNQDLILLGINAFLRDICQVTPEFIKMHTCGPDLGTVLGAYLKKMDCVRAVYLTLPGYAQSDLASPNTLLDLDQDRIEEYQSGFGRCSSGLQLSYRGTRDLLHSLMGSNVEELSLESCLGCHSGYVLRLLADVLPSTKLKSIDIRFDPAARTNPCSANDMRYFTGSLVTSSVTNLRLTNIKIDGDVAKVLALGVCQSQVTSLTISSPTWEGALGIINTRDSRSYGKESPIEHLSIEDSLWKHDLEEQMKQLASQAGIKAVFT